MIIHRDSKEGETEVFSNEKMKITIVMKKFDNPNLFNVLFRYYSLTDTTLTDFSLNVSPVNSSSLIFIVFYPEVHCCKHISHNWNSHWAYYASFPAVSGKWIWFSNRMTCSFCWQKVNRWSCVFLEYARQMVRISLFKLAVLKFCNVSFMLVGMKLIGLRFDHCIHSNHTINNKTQTIISIIMEFNDFLSTSKRNLVFTSLPNLPAFLEWHFREY